MIKLRPELLQPDITSRTQAIEHLVALETHMKQVSASVALELTAYEELAETIRANLMQDMQDSGEKSFKTAGGIGAVLKSSFIATVDTKNNPDAWDKIFAFVREHNRFDLLTKKVSSTKVLETIQGDPANGIEPTAVPCISVLSKLTLAITQPK
jgi:hypothetical protein